MRSAVASPLFEMINSTASLSRTDYDQLSPSPSSRVMMSSGGWGLGVTAARIVHESVSPSARVIVSSGPGPFAIFHVSLSPSFFVMVSEPGGYSSAHESVSPVVSVIVSSSGPIRGSAYTSRRSTSLGFSAVDIDLMIIQLRLAYPGGQVRRVGPSGA